MSTQPDHYATLHVSPDATAREITRAYRALLRTHHPDTRQRVDDGDTTSAADLQELHAIMQAYVVLSDPREAGGLRSCAQNTRRYGRDARKSALPPVRIHGSPTRAVPTVVRTVTLGSFTPQSEITQE